MTEYVFRDAAGFGCDMDEMMDGGRVTVGEYFATENTDHYGTLHEEVVRCRDCKFFIKNINGIHCIKSIAILTDADGFCAWGERRGA